VGPLSAPSLAHTASGFCSLAEKTVRTKLTYRLSTVIAFLSHGLGYAVFLLIWLEVYRAAPHERAMPRETLISYLTLGFVLNSLLALSVEARFGLRLHQGLIVSDLLRPLGFLLQQLAQAMGDVIVNALLIAPVYALAYVFLGPAIVPDSLSSLLLGSFSGLLALLINFSLSYLIVQAFFVLHSGYGILFMRVAMHQVFSGLSAPLIMFPEALRGIAAVLPFRHIIETPVLLWLGEVPQERIVSALTQQLGWAIALLGIGASIFSLALRRHQIQGG
jgi:ABC-2 type transport system permease protein